jgi:hypothetical protein
MIDVLCKQKVTGRSRLAPSGRISSGFRDVFWTVVEPPSNFDLRGRRWEHRGRVIFEDGDEGSLSSVASPTARTR